MDQLRGTRILVTGGSGVIGRELVRRLVGRGGLVLSVDRQLFPGPLPEGARCLSGDLVDFAMEELLAFRPQAVFHLAAAFERSLESPGFWPVNWHDNLVASHRIGDLVAGLEDVRRLVFASSYLIYAPHQYLSDTPTAPARALLETDPVEPRNVCGAAKYYSEQEWEFIRRYLRPALRVVNARIFRVYGCGSRDIVSRWVRAATREEPVEVYNAANRFDYIYAGDVAEGLVRLSESRRADGVVNLGSGTPRSVRELIQVIDRCFPGFAERAKDRRATERYEASVADLSRLRAWTGWAPPTSLEEGVRAVAAYQASSEER